MFERNYPFKRQSPFLRSPMFQHESDSLFHDMKKYQTGYNESGNPQFAVPLTADDDGLLGRECPASDCSPRYFKVSIQKVENGEAPLNDAKLTCPYCSHAAPFQEFHTRAQIEWVKAMMLRDVEQQIVRNLNNSFRKLNNMRGLFRINVTARATSLPAVYKYVEQKLKRSTTCSQCGQQYAVYGVSYHCPLCGGGTLSVHLLDSITTLRILAGEAEHIGEKHGTAAQEAMLGNAYGGAVSLFEGFLKCIYGYGVRKKFPSAEAERLEKQIRTSFQRLDDAELLMQRDLTVVLFHGVPQADRDRLGIVFSKRHVLTHNLGLVDVKYRDKVRSWEKPGQEVPVSAKEITWAVDLIDQLLTAAANSVGI